MSTAIGLSTRKHPAEDSNEDARILDRLTLAARIEPRTLHQRRLQEEIRSFAKDWNPGGLDWDRFFPGTGPKLLQKSIILKTKREHEKGVLFVSFEDNWLRLFRHADFHKVSRDYDLILSPTWSPPYDLAMLVAARLWPGPIYTILSNHEDEPLFQTFTDSVRTIPLLASSWVNREKFAGAGTQKEFDIVVLANSAQYKRHFALFRALAKARKTKRISVLLVGGPWNGRTQSDLLREASLFGVDDQVTARGHVPRAELASTIQSAKVGVIMSKGEGSCVAVTELLYSNVPVALIEGARIGSRAFINEHTGAFLREESLHTDLLRFVENYQNYRPREWMLREGKSCIDSTQLMNSILRAWAERDGRPWTRDIVAMQWDPNPGFVCREHAEAMELEYRRFEREYGIPFQFRSERPFSGPTVPLSDPLG